jgi:hypothetical protein
MNPYEAYVEAGWLLNTGGVNRHGIPAKFSFICYDDRQCYNPHCFHGWTSSTSIVYEWSLDLSETEQFCGYCSCDGLGWEFLGALSHAGFEYDSTLRYISVLCNGPYWRSSPDYDECYEAYPYTKWEIIQQIQDKEAKVFIGCQPGQLSMYSDFAINGVVKADSSRFFQMIATIQNDVDQAYNNPQEPEEEYDPNACSCDPIYVDTGEDEETYSTLSVNPTGSTPASVVPVMISTNPDLEPNPQKRYPAHDVNYNCVQTEDGKITVTFTLDKANKKYRFIVRDPMDESPYVNIAPNKRRNGDNYPLGNGEYGSLDAPNAVHEHHGRVVYAKTDSNRIDVTPIGRADIILAHSPVLVAWKRVYLEIDRMYRQPGFFQDAEHEPSSFITFALGNGDTQAYVESNAMFSTGESVIIFDNQGQKEGHIIQAKGNHWFYGDYVEFNTPVIHNFEHGAVAAILKANAEVFDNDMVGRLKEAYGDISDPSGKIKAGCFVQFNKCPTGCDVLPYLAPIDTSLEREKFSDAWFVNRDKINAVHLLLIDRIDNGTTLGISEKEFHFSYISWRKANSENITKDIQATVVHELCHQFWMTSYVDKDKTDGDHSNVPAWSWTSNMPRNSRRCIMDYSGNGRDYDWKMPCQFCRPHLMRIRKESTTL